MLYRRLVRLAHENPELRKFLVPMLRKFASEAPMQEEGFEGPDEGEVKPKGEKPKAPSGKKRKGPPPKWDEFMQSVYGGKDAKLPNPNTDPKIRERHPDLLISTILSEYPESPTAKRVMEKYKEWLKDQGKGHGKAPAKAEKDEPKAPAKPKKDAPKPKLEVNAAAETDKEIRGTSKGGRNVTVPKGTKFEIDEISGDTLTLFFPENYTLPYVLVKKADIQHLFKSGTKPQPKAEEPKAEEPKTPGEKPARKPGAEVTVPKGTSHKTDGAWSSSPLPKDTTVVFQKVDENGRWQFKVKDTGHIVTFHGNEVRKFFKDPSKPGMPKPKTPGKPLPKVTIPKGKLKINTGYREETSSDKRSLNQALSRLNDDLKGTELQTRKSIAHLVGVPFIPTPKGQELQTTISGNSYQISVNTTGGWIQSFARTIKGGSKPSIHNDVFKLEKDAPEGIGARVFMSEVLQAHAAGFHHIECYAVLSPPDWYGAKVWPKLGYDGEVPRRVAENLPKELKQAMKDNGFNGPPWRISHLWQTVGGAEWWEDNGDSFNAEFDLTPGSYSMRFAQAYMENKAEKEGFASVEDWLKMPDQDYWDKEAEKQRAAMARTATNWWDHLAAKEKDEKSKKDKGKGKKKEYEDISVNQTDTDFSLSYWKTFKKDKK